MKHFKPGQRAKNKVTGLDCIVNGFTDDNQNTYDVYIIDKRIWGNVPADDLIPHREEKLKLI